MLNVARHPPSERLSDALRDWRHFVHLVVEREKKHSGQKILNFGGVPRRATGAAASFQAAQAALRGR